LEERRKIILNSEKITSNMQEADNFISENAIDSISMAIRALEKIETIDDKYKNISNNLKSNYYELQELARDINSFKEEIEFDEEERNYIEERLDLIYSLKRKYGNNIEEIVNYREQITREIEYIENIEEYNNKLIKEKNSIIEKMDILSKELHNKRVNSAKKLSKEVNDELEDLVMKNAKINVRVEYLDEEYFKTGKDIVEFYVVTNKGEDEKELTKIASGGEMSRIMLAIKKVLAEADKVSVLIFDEIDTGISGKAANSVAKKLNKISEKHQVMCISHLPNIAAMADYNYYISKDVCEERTKTKIKLLKESEVIKEIARISSGEINDISLKYANDLRSKKAS
ncbi:MAG: DNA repair protein RecN, partial [Clostridia bacterium]|nr:DNA repair protein RecN [Clostridia bacterium]